MSLVQISSFHLVALLKVGFPIFIKKPTYTYVVLFNRLGPSCLGDADEGCQRADSHGCLGR